LRDVCMDEKKEKDERANAGGGGREPSLLKKRPRERCRLIIEGEEKGTSCEKGQAPATPGRRDFLGERNKGSLRKRGTYNSLMARKKRGKKPRRGPGKKKLLLFVGERHCQDAESRAR